MPERLHQRKLTPRVSLCVLVKHYDLQVSWTGVTGFSFALPTCIQLGHAVVPMEPVLASSQHEIRCCLLSRSHLLPVVIIAVMIAR